MALEAAQPERPTTQREPREAAPPPLDRPPGLFLRFALAATLALVAAGAAVFVVVRHEVIRQAEHNAALHTLTTARSAVPEIATRADFERPVGARRRAELDAWFRRYLVSQGSRALTFYSRAGAVTYSTEPARIGRPSTVLSAVREALERGGSHRVARLQEDNGGRGLKVLESYAPVSLRPGARPAGVVASYESYGPTAHLVVRTKRRIAAALLVVLLGLFGALLPLLRRTTRRHEAHTSRLEVQSRTLERARAENRAFLEAIPDAMLRIRRDGTILDYKAAAFVPTAAPEQFLGRPVADVLPPEVAQKIMVAMASVAATRRPHRFEYELASGPSPGSFETRVVWLSDDEVLVIVRDITEREEAAEALREEKHRFEAVFESALDGIVTMDDGRRFADANVAACELLGVPREELIGKRLDDFTPADARHGLRGAWDEFLVRGVHEGVFRILRPDGSEREADFRARANILPGRHLSLLRDVTEQKRLEGQLVQAQRMETVGRLAGGIAHDFNNLLMAIQGYTELALANLSGSEQRLDGLTADLGEIHAAAERGARLTAQLLAFSRRQVLRPQVIDLNELLQGIENLLRRLIGEQVELELRLSERLGRVTADPSQLEQVIMNLGVNARDAMPDGGTLTIQTRNVTLSEQDHARFGLEPGSYVRLSVSDTGTGMSEETRTHVFEPFFTVGKRGGTGLGLSTVYGVVTQSGGQVWVESEPGRGATFHILLPRVRGRRPVPEEVAEHHELASGSETVLVVEDEADVRRLVERALTGAGYEVLAASGPREALALCERHPGRIDLVLSDVVMPELTGPELVDRIAPLRPDIKVLYMSGYSHDAVARHGVAEPKAALISKPFSLAALTERVREVLDLRPSDVTS